MKPLHLTKEQKEILAELGRVGGQTRAKNLTAKRRTEIAILASTAATKARQAKAGKNVKCQPDKP